MSRVKAREASALTLRRVLQRPADRRAAREAEAVRILQQAEQARAEAEGRAAREQGPTPAPLLVSRPNTY